MNRRGFLGAMLGAMAAPAIVKAENIMKIIVPPERKIITRVGRGLSSPIFMVAEPPFIQPTQEQIIEDIRSMAFKLYEQSGYTHSNTTRLSHRLLLESFDPNAPMPKIDLSRGGQMSWAPSW